jgi:hypothetical protein
LVSAREADSQDIFLLAAKALMAAKCSFNWHHLNQLRHSTHISTDKHLITDITIINQNKKLSRDKWKSCKKQSFELRKKNLSERATYLAAQMRTSEEKALIAIMKSEEARCIYHNIKQLLGKQQQIFTQVDIMSPSKDVESPMVTLTQQTDIEREILSRNRRHSLQSYQTPFLANPIHHLPRGRHQQNGSVFRRLIPFGRNTINLFK